jgi:hypothetical protein
MWSSLDVEKGPILLDHMIGRTIDNFATRTREIARGRGVELILMSATEVSAVPCSSIL